MFEFLSVIKLPYYKVWIVIVFEPKVYIVESEIVVENLWRNTF